MPYTGLSAFPLQLPQDRDARVNSQGGAGWLSQARLSDRKRQQGLSWARTACSVSFLLLCLCLPQYRFLEEGVHVQFCPRNVVSPQGVAERCDHHQQ